MPVQISLPFPIQAERERFWDRSIFEEYTVKYNNMIWDALQKETMGKNHAYLRTDEKCISAGRADTF